MNAEVGAFSALDFWGTNGGFTMDFLAVFWTFGVIAPKAAVSFLDFSGAVWTFGRTKVQEWTLRYGIGVG